MCRKYLFVGSDDLLCTAPMQYQQRQGKMKKFQRTDKETQSPILNVFKQIIKMEKTMDPEKTNLLRGKRKKKSFGTRNVTEQSSDSNSLANELPPKYNNIDRTEKARYKSDSVVNAAVNITRGKSGQSRKGIDSDSTPSCIDSCILFGKEVKKYFKLSRSSGIKKKIFKHKLNGKLRTHSVCLIMLAVMVAILLIAIALVFSPLSASSAGDKDDTKNGDPGGMLKSGSDGNNWGKRDSSLDSFMRDGNFRLNDASLRESNSYMPGMMSDELSTIIDPGIINDQSSPQLRDFYRRLIQTGEKLNRLKTKLTEDSPDSNNVLKTSPYRKKRSLKFVRIPRNIFTKNKNNVTGDAKRRSDSNNTNLGIVIEKAKVYVQYSDKDIKHPNAIETAQDTAVHKNEIRRPFHENSHKFDAVYNLIVDRSARDIKKEQNLYYRNPNDKKIVQSEVNNEESNPKAKPSNDKKLGQNVVKENIEIDKHVQRKLLQVKDDSQNSDNDEKEVVSERKEIVDKKPSLMAKTKAQLLSKETKTDRNFLRDTKLSPNFFKQVSRMIDTVVLQNLYSRPKTRRNIDVDYDEKEVNNNADIEDYEQAKPEDKNSFAQAYSDYGVLDSKKETSHEKYSENDNRAEKRVKLSIDTTTTTSQSDDHDLALSTKIANILKAIKTRLDSKKCDGDEESHSEVCAPQQFTNKHKQTPEEQKKSGEKTKHSVDLDLMQFTQRGKRTLKSVYEISSNDELARSNQDKDTENIDDAKESAVEKDQVNQNNNIYETSTTKSNIHASNNITFRTRSLLSTEEKILDVGKVASNNEVTTENRDGKKANNEPTNPTIELKTENKTTTNHNDQSNESKSTTEKMKKNVVKRNAIDDGSIFWEDVYDDEYGMDINENKLRDKFSIKEEFVKKSELWFHNKMQKLKDKWRANRNDVKINLNRTSNGSSNEVLRDKTVVKRSIGNGKKRASSHDADFAALTANMKVVCKNAVEAIQKTKNIKVRGESTESQQSVSLMQQLASLMNDLVNFQVQEKTCLKLTPDLRKFLAWLVLPGQQQSASSYADDNLYSDNFAANEQSYHEDSTDSLQTPDTMETLQSVQDLLQRYQKMSDEDKSRMSGVKEYLENKEKLLNSRISGYDDIYSQVKNLRYRRNIPFKLRRRPHKFTHLSNEPQSKSRTEVQDDKKQKSEKINKE